MTRNFSNQRRDGMQPSSRNSASGKYREEQSSRPARPRLSRDAVDRAWENGATRTYADYRPRQNPPTSPAQRQGRPAPAYERSRQPQNRRPYEPSQETYGTPRQGGYQPRQQPEGGPRPFNRPGYRAPGGQPNLNNERWTRPSTPQQPGGYTERNEENRPPRFRQDGPNNYNSAPRPARFQQSGPNYRGANQPSRFQQDGPRNYDNASRPPRFQQDGPRNPYSAPQPSRFQQSGPNNYRGSNQPSRFQQDGPDNYRGPQRSRPFERSDREREQFARGQRGNAPTGSRDNYNPRWQSRPGPQREYTHQQREYPTPRNDNANERPGRAQFEGDYERFTDYEHADTREPAAQIERPAPTYEKPVTRLPDGRVLKGPRPAQRKEARFWNGVEGETSELLAKVAPPQTPEESPLPQEQPVEEKKTPTRAARPKKPGESRTRKVKTVKSVRSEDAKPLSAKVARKNARGPQQPVTRPSRRGYKWPTAGE